ncbi:MAG: hypothetical protein K0Q85_1103, partial [Caproiciproducens sp.]|nr:hypothetical protein [Caproiciproducens sp.]
MKRENNEIDKENHSYGACSV